MRVGFVNHGLDDVRLSCARKARVVAARQRSRHRHVVDSTVNINPDIFRGRTRQQIVRK